MGFSSSLDINAYFVERKAEARPSVLFPCELMELMRDTGFLK